mmetsp:Transcript_17529/g.23180  ORF Transcript_17529/g.23180 Transcript_17529/m.23180 type:complete len:93 (+) Transcript_17529:37-315(+)
MQCQCICRAPSHQLSSVQYCLHCLAQDNTFQPSSVPSSVLGYLQSSEISSIPALVRTSTSLLKPGYMLSLILNGAIFLVLLVVSGVNHFSFL